MTESQITKNKLYNLEERTLELSKNSLLALKRVPQTLINSPLIGQAVRSTTSIGANYIEANEALGKKDFILRIRISRKESKESVYWLKLVISNNYELPGLQELKSLLDECSQLVKILSRIIVNSK